MGTSYTEIIEIGGSFKKYALRCARAFGYLYAMRNLPMDAPIPDDIENKNESSQSYYIKSLNEKLVELKQWEITSDKQKKVFFTNLKKITIQRAKKMIRENRSLDLKYERMKIKISSWTAPSPSHEELKKFMLDQIQIGHHSMTKFYTDEFNEWTALTFEVWKENYHQSLIKSIVYYNEYVKKDKEKSREMGANEWVKLLKESL